MGVHHRLGSRCKRNRCPNERVRSRGQRAQTTRAHRLQADQGVVPDAHVVDDALRGTRNKRSESVHIGFIV